MLKVWLLRGRVASLSHYHSLDRSLNIVEPFLNTERGRPACRLGLRFLSKQCGVEFIFPFWGATPRVLALLNELRCEAIGIVIIMSSVLFFDPDSVAGVREKPPLLPVPLVAADCPRCVIIELFSLRPEVITPDPSVEQCNIGCQVLRVR